MCCASSNSRRGFTLIELMVVIGIIALLSTIVLVTLNVARAKTRDISRIRELKEMETALAIYYSKYLTYPITNGANHGWVNECDAGVAFVIPELVTEKLFAGVHDPIACNHW